MKKKKCYNHQHTKNSTYQGYQFPWKNTKVVEQYTLDLRYRGMPLEVEVLIDQETLRRVELSSL